MTQTTEDKALAMVNQICREKGILPYVKLFESAAEIIALRRAIEQHEAFRQRVSAVADYAVKNIEHGLVFSPNILRPFIIPAPKPDPLVEIMEVLNGEWTPDEYANAIRAALEARGFEIREKNDG